MIRVKLSINDTAI